MRLKSIVALVALMCAGCARLQTIEPSLNRPAGAQPTVADAEAIILNNLSVALKDPDSIKEFAVVEGPIGVSWKVGPAAGTVHFAGAWAFCYQLNAKNSFGAYAGLRSYAIALREVAPGRFEEATDVIWAQIPYIAPMCPRFG